MLVTLEDLIENLSVAYVEVDADLHISTMNEAAEALLHVTGETAIGQRLEQVIPDATRSQHWSALVELITSGRKRTLSVFYPGQYRWHEVRVIPIKSGGAGLLMHDVTDRQWLIRREAERVYLQSTFEDAYFALTIIRAWSPKGLTIEYMNALARQLTGNRPVIGMPVREAFSDIEQRHLFDILEGVYRDGTPFSSRDVYVRWDRNGNGIPEEGYFDVSYRPIRDFDGKMSGVLSIAVEVTERVHLKRRTAEHATPIAETENLKERPEVVPT